MSKSDSIAVTMTRREADLIGKALVDYLDRVHGLPDPDAYALAYMFAPDDVTAERMWRRHEAVRLKRPSTARQAGE